MTVIDMTKKLYQHLIFAKNAGSSYSVTCMSDSLDKDLIGGKIVVCERGDVASVIKGQTVKEAGGVGVVVANVAPIGEGLRAKAYLIPSIAVTESAVSRIVDYLNSSKNPRAKMVFRGTEVGVQPAPVVSSFSARGPSVQSTYILKPDMIAPGVNIRAAWPDDVPPTGLSSDMRCTEFNIIFGTSMLCPHVSGMATLVKGAHIDWSPSMIRLALMTTAYMQDREGKQLLNEKSYNMSTVWDMGVGHVDPERALDPGLVYDLRVRDYLNFLCSSNYNRQDIRQIAEKSVSCNSMQRKPWNLNYPAITIAFNKSGSSNSEVVIERTVTHVSESASSYTVTMTNPKGASVTVDPTKMNFKKKGQKQVMWLGLRLRNKRYYLGMK